MDLIRAEPELMSKQRMQTGPLPDSDQSIRDELILRNHQVQRGRALPDSCGGVVVGPVTWAEVASEFAAPLALTHSKRNAAEMRADADRDQPVFANGPLRKGFRIAECWPPQPLLA